MFRRLAVIFAILGMVGGGLAVGAGAASAGTVPQPVTFSGQQHNVSPEPVQFNRDRDRDRFCTRADIRLLDRLLFLQSIGVHLNRFERAELRFLERACGFRFFDEDQFGFPFDQRVPLQRA
jgi:hypothetical protein